jgi:two-component system chemotaxis response regulator CheB
VLVVEDSATARRHVVSVLAATEDFEVVAQARTGEEAIKAAAALAPDIISLDVYLPDLTAAEVVRRVLQVRAVPILLLSDAPRNAADVFLALEAGALDFLPKPRVDDPAREKTLLMTLRQLATLGSLQPAVTSPRAAVAPRVTPAVVVIASSTGGPAALKALLGALPRGFAAPVLIAQHLTPGFEEGMARWLGEGCTLPVRVVKGPVPVVPGVFLGDPDHDLVLRSRSEVVSLSAPSRGYHPSGDLLFESATAAFGAAVVAVVMSGIGSDGLRGATAVQKAGGLILAQAGAPVRGMPESVIRAGLTTFDGAPGQLAARLAALTQAKT